MENKLEVLHTIELDMKKLTMASLWQTIILSVIGVILYFLLNGLHISLSLSGFFLFLLFYVVLIILHEFFHLLGFWVYGKVPWKSMDYGVNLSLGVAYATTTVPIPNKAMKKALLLPFWVTGVIPMLLGYIDHSLTLVILGAWLIAGAAGDIAMYKELKKFPNDILIKDHPTEPKLYIIKKVN